MIAFGRSLPVLTSYEGARLASNDGIVDVLQHHRLGSKIDGPSGMLQSVTSHLRR